VRWYLRYGLSYRDVEALLGERGIEVDHVTIYRWAQTSLRSSSTRPARRGTALVTGGSSTTRTSRRDGRCGAGVLHPRAEIGPAPVEVTTDRAPAIPIDDSASRLAGSGG
jgi:hypothetical protein